MTGPFAPSPQSGKVQRTIYASANRQTHRSQFVRRLEELEYRRVSQNRTLAEIVGSIDVVVVSAHSTCTLPGEPIDAANAVAISAGYRSIGERWRELDDRRVLGTLAYFIGHDLAYSSEQLMPVEQCRSLAQELLAYADTNARWFTNLSLGERGVDHYSVDGWTAISDWTFDAAFVAVGDTTTLIICFFAED